MSLVRLEFAGVGAKGKAPPVGTVLRDVRSRLDEQMLDFLTQAASMIQAAIVESISENWLRLSKGRKSGLLMSSFAPSIVDNGDGTFTSGVFSDVVYARIHEVGGIIRPKKSFLTVPLKEFPLGTRARDFSDLVFAHSKAGKLFLVKPTQSKLDRMKALNRGRRLPIRTRRGRPVLASDELFYFLAESVRIRPKRYLEQAAESVEPMLADFAQTFWAEVLGGQR